MSCVLYMSTILFWSRDIAKIDRVGMKLCKLGVWLEQDIMLHVSSEHRWNMTAILGCLIESDWFNERVVKALGLDDGYAHVKHTPAKTKPLAPWTLNAVLCLCWICLLCSPCWNCPSRSSWGSCSIWAKLFDGVTTKFGNVPTKVGQPRWRFLRYKRPWWNWPKRLVEFEPYPIGVSSSTLQLWSHSCTGWNKEFRWQSILPLPHVIVGKVVEPRSLWAVFKLMSTLVLEHTLCWCYQTRYCKLEEARASCEELGRLFALLPRWNAIVIWFLEASILHWVGNCSCHFCLRET